ncbi:MAG: hypothetical protein H6671_03455 [Anaerolineaceae bacterium]|nr:hypothetical protein [Anaerolineae bacterium]MCB9455026.1 hypothetical protein [Anaerolineaceae bacterium]
MLENDSLQPDTNRDGMLILGFLLGLLTGGLVALFWLPRPGLLASKRLSTEGMHAHEALTVASPVDSVAASIAEGRAAAHRRRIEMGLD